MKFIFDKVYTDAMQEMSEEDGEREMKLNPTNSTANEFKSFTCGFMFSTAKQLNLIQEMNNKLDTAITISKANAEEIKDVKADVATLKVDLQNAVDFKDQEIAILKDDINANKTTIEDLDAKLVQCIRDQKQEVTYLRKLCAKLEGETLTLERYTRSYNFRLLNEPDVPGEKSRDVMEKVNKLILEVTGKPITVEYGHRTGAPRDDGKPRPIICRIASRAQKMEVMSKRGDFFKKDRPIFDDLPKADLEAKQKHAAVMKQFHDQDRKTQFIRGKWFLDGVEYKG